MCKALQDLYEEGIGQGIEQGIRELIVRKYRKGVSIEEIADFVEMSCEKVQEIVEE